MANEVVVQEETTQPLTKWQNAITTAKRCGTAVKDWFEIQSKPEGISFWRRTIGPGKGFPWVAGALFHSVVLAQVVSPLITKLALVPLILPVAAFVLFAWGEFDVTKLQGVLAGNLGLVVSIGSILMIALFIQSVVKVTRFIQSFFGEQESKSARRSNALAGTLAPIATFGIWALLADLGYFLVTAKGIGVMVVGAFAGPAVGQAVQSIDWNGTITPEQIAIIANQVSVWLRIAFCVVLGLHLALVWGTYHYTYKGIEAVLNGIVRFYKPAADLIRRYRPKREEDWLLSIAASILVLLVGSCSVDYAIETPAEKQEQIAEARQDKIDELARRSKDWREGWKTWCSGNLTFAEAKGKVYQLTESEKVPQSGTIPSQPTRCFGELTPRLHLGEFYSEGSSYRGTLVIADAAGYKSGGGERGSCFMSKEDGDAFGRTMGDHCRNDLRVNRAVRYWVELPEGLPKGVSVPPLPDAKTLESLEK